MHYIFADSIDYASDEILKHLLHADLAACAPQDSVTRKRSHSMKVPDICVKIYIKCETPKK